MKNMSILITKELAQKIASKRKKLGLSQPALAKKCRLAKSLISRVESGETRILRLTALKLAQALRLPEEYFGIESIPRYYTLPKKRFWSWEKFLDFFRGVSRG